MGRLSVLAVVLCCSLLWGCGGAEIGEECDEVGSGDECVDNAVCTNEEDDTAACRQLCDDQADCPDGHDCNGVSGTSQKSCQPKR